MALNRRAFLKTTGLMALAPAWPLDGAGTLVNDIHSQLNPTRVREIVSVDSTGALQRAVRRAAEAGHAICIAGGRHAMGAQQFAGDAVMLDTTKLNRVRSFDRAKGIVEVDAGIMWPALIDHLLESAGRPVWPVGNRPEADRRGPADNRGRAVSERPWPRPSNEAVHRRRRIVRPG